MHNLSYLLLDTDLSGSMSVVKSLKESRVLISRIIAPYLISMESCSRTIRITEHMNHLTRLDIDGTIEYSVTSAHSCKY